MLLIVLIFAYVMGGIWSAERFRENGPLEILAYIAVVFFWPLFWFMVAVQAKEDDE